jgi:hypothetical protein
MVPAPRSAPAAELVGQVADELLPVQLWPDAPVNMADYSRLSRSLPTIPGGSRRTRIGGGRLGVAGVSTARRGR